MPKPHPPLPSAPETEYSVENNPHSATAAPPRLARGDQPLSGLRHAVLEESAFRQELTLVVIFTPCAFLLPILGGRADHPCWGRLLLALHRRRC